MTDDTDLHDRLTDIDGVGDATAEKIEAVVAETTTTPDSRLLERAIEAASHRNDRQASIFLRRYAVADSGSGEGE